MGRTDGQLHKFKMLLSGYLYGIKSERRLVEEIQLNIAYRWFCGFDLREKIPDHSTFSKTRIRKWNESNLFRQAFTEIVHQCITAVLVDGKEMVADGSYIPAQVSKSSWIEVEEVVEASMQSCLDALNQELVEQPGFKKPSVHTEKKRRITSSTDPECGGINHGNKRGIGYLLEATVDCKNGIVTGVDVFPANQKAGIRRRILGSSRYPAFHRGHMGVGSPDYRLMMKKKIWAEGCFSVLKREHCLSAVHKRGLLAAAEECLLSALALNLKEMAKALLFIQRYSILSISFSISRGFFLFVNRAREVRNFGTPSSKLSCV